MRIQHNIAALNAYRQLGNNNNSVSKNLEKLSSGYRINRAGDDAAGLAISEKMRAQITGLETAQKNANDGISLVQTAEGALTEVHSMLNRMVELADQSANATYQDQVDRENLQKEVTSLKSEINRISDSTNFNGINLLDGSVNETTAITAGTITATSTPAELSKTLGTFGTEVDGEKKDGTDTVAYSTNFYFGEITNTDASAAKNIVFKYNDNTGTEKSITLAVSAGTTVKAEDFAKALNGDTVTGITVTDGGTAFDATVGKGGQFKELYSASSDGNIITITANKDKDAAGTVDTIAGDKLISAKLDDMSTAWGDDFTTATETLKSNYDDTTADAIEFGSKAGQDISYVKEEKASYTVASKEFTLDAAITSGKAAHNTAITVGDHTYVIQSSNAELKGTDGTEKIVTVDDGDSVNDIAAKLAVEITKDKGLTENGGYVATATGNKLLISESTTRGADIRDDITNTKSATTAESIASTKELTLVAASAETGSGTLATLDASKMVNGTSVTANGKTYTFVSNADAEVAEGDTKIVFSSNDTSEDLATKLANQLTADGVTGASADGASVKLTDSNITKAASAEGAGLTLQIGDTADTFNRMSVKISSTSAKSLGIDNVDISTASGAASSIAVIKNAINSVSSTRGDLGAIQNRLEHTINNLNVTSENMTAAESRVRDVDMAKEMMNYTKNNILVQASQAMLAQANQVPQGVLQLLR